MSLSIYPLINGFCVASRYPSLWNIYSRTYQGTDGRLKQSVEFASRPKAGSSTINTIMAGQATTTVSNTVTKCDIVIFHHNILIKLSYCHKFHDIKGRFLPSTLPGEGAWLVLCLVLKLDHHHRHRHYLTVLFPPWQLLLLLLKFLVQLLLLQPLQLLLLLLLLLFLFLTSCSCYSFLKGRKITLSCSYRSTC